MLYTLGLNFLHSDTSACIFKDGELIAAAEEERYVRVKHTTAFPYKSIDFCLSSANIDISQVDFITVNSNPFSSLLKKIIFILKNPSSLPIALNRFSNTKKN